jgi:hypothetical protein
VTVRIRRVAVPLVFAGVAFASAGAAAGCAAETEPAPPQAEAMLRPAPVPTTRAASVAGGACALLDYAVIEKTVGVRFDIAANMRSAKTDTCVVQAEARSLPDLSLAVTATTADAEIFGDEVVPADADGVKGLGAAAYKITYGPLKGAGASVEVGWLSKSKRLMVLRFTTAVGGDTKAAAALAPKLVALAKQVDAAKPAVAASGT